MTALESILSAKGERLRERQRRSREALDRETREREQELADWQARRDEEWKAECERERLSLAPLLAWPTRGAK